MSKNDQNTCLETPDTTPNARLRQLSSYEDIPSLILALVCKIRPRASEEAIETIQFMQHNTLQRLCAVRNNQENCSKRFVFLPKPIKIRI